MEYHQIIVDDIQKRSFSNSIGPIEIMTIHKKNHDFGLLFFVRDSRHDAYGVLLIVTKIDDWYAIQDRPPLPRPSTEDPRETRC